MSKTELFLRESREYWIAEAGRARRENDRLWAVLYVVPLACGLFFLLGSLL